MKLSYYKNGTKVKIGGIVWTILSKSDSGILCITSPIVEYGVFCQKPRENNNWETSDAREYLNGEFLDKLIRGMRVRDENPDDIIEQTIDLTTDDGLKDYGSCKDKIFLLTCEQYRQYRKFINSLNDWWWLLTADSSCNSFVKYVNADGSISSNVSNYYAERGFRPACVFNPSIPAQEMWVSK